MITEIMVRKKNDFWELSEQLTKVKSFCLNDINFCRLFNAYATFI